MDTITARLRHDYPEVYPPNGGLTFGIVPLMEQVVGDVRRTLYLLLGAVGFVLLIACANVANLQLSRTVARQKEIAVRSALGATRVRVVRQLLTESVLLALCGGVARSCWRIVSVHWIRVLGPQSVPRLSDVSIDGTALLFTFTISVLSACCSAWRPRDALHGIDVQNTLQDTSRTSAGVGAVWGAGNNLRRLLVVSELALCVMLLIGAGLLIRSFLRVHDVSPGFNPHNVLTLELTMSGPRVQRQAGGVGRLSRTLAAAGRPARRESAAGAVTSLPLSQMYAWGPITVEGRVPPPGEKFINADTRMVSGHYFQAMGIPLLAGRLLRRSRRAGQSARGDRRRLHGAAALAGPGCRRQALSHRRHRRHECAVDHRRRRGRPGEAVHARFRLAHRLLSSADPISDACHERRGAQQHRSRALWPAP